MSAPEELERLAREPLGAEELERLAVTGPETLAGQGWHGLARMLRRAIVELQGWRALPVPEAIAALGGQVERLRHIAACAACAEAHRVDLALRGAPVEPCPRCTCGTMPSGRDTGGPRTVGPTCPKHPPF